MDLTIAALNPAKDTGSPVCRFIIHRIPLDPSFLNLLLKQATALA